MLLALARRSIASALSGTAEPEPGDVSSEVARRAGAFVTLRKRDGDLRGCVGYTEPRLALWRTVIKAARAAAFHDGRFPRVTAGELGSLSIQISVLGALAPIRPEEVSIGIHGLVVDHEGRRGLLLPQVAPEQGWDREELLAQTCRKAGLDVGAWRDPGCQVLAFTAEYFGENQGPGRA